MEPNRQLDDARDAMMRARVALDDYVSGSETDLAKLLELYSVLEAATADYVRFVSLEMYQKYGSLNNPERP